MGYLSFVSSEYSWSDSSLDIKSSTISRAIVSVYWTGGDFMKYADGPNIGPDKPLSRAIFAHLRASMTTPAELGPVSYTHLTLPTICSV